MSEHVRHSRRVVGRIREFRDVLVAELPMTSATRLSAHAGPETINSNIEIRNAARERIKSLPRLTNAEYLAASANPSKRATHQAVALCDVPHIEDQPEESGPIRCWRLADLDRGADPVADQRDVDIPTCSLQRRR
jgi:hypothetical protein